MDSRITYPITEKLAWRLILSEVVDDIL